MASSLEVNLDHLFIHLPGVKYVPVPIELFNEPFAFQDNGKRVQIVTSTRKRFRFVLDTRLNEVNCWIGLEKVISYEFYLQEEVPIKTITSISVFSVYDIYGLDIACSFVRHLIHLAKKNEDTYNWIAAYLIASLCVVCPEIGIAVRIDGDYVLSVVTPILLLKLIQLDAAQPRLASELIPQDSGLPIELLSRILDNPCLSTKIRDGVMAARSRQPIISELEEHNENAAALLLSDGSYLIYCNETGYENLLYVIHLNRCGDKFIVEVTDEKQPDAYNLNEAEYVAFSISNYTNWFKSRGCDYNCTQRFYSELRSSLTEVNDSNVDLACGWLLQLYLDTGMIEERKITLNGFDGLRDELQSVFTVFFRQSRWE